MRFLLDSNLSPRVAMLMRAAGMDAEHVRDHGLQSEPDVVILAFARDNDFVVVSEDTDFGELLAREKTAAPSLVLLHTNGPIRPTSTPRSCWRTSRACTPISSRARWSSWAKTGSGCAAHPCCHRCQINVNREPDDERSARGRRRRRL